MRRAGIALCALAAACVPARSLVFGQTAAPMPVGALEASVSAGPAFMIPGPSSEGDTSQGRSYGVTLPALEANLLYGLAPPLDLSLHASALGVQPGVKIALLSGDLRVAALIETAINYSASTTVPPGGPESGTTTYVFMVGAKVLASLPQGVYAGLGYSFQHQTQAATGALAGQGSDFGAHNLTVGAGWEIEAGALGLRLEMTTLFTSEGSIVFTNGGTRAVSGKAGPLWILFPSVTVAAASE